MLWLAKNRKVEGRGKTYNGMIDCLRETITCNQIEPLLGTQVEIDEVYVVAGHKEQPEKIKAADCQWYRWKT